MELDDTDRSILSMLQQDGRRSYTSIAQELGLGEGVVRYRATRLTNSGIMQIVAVTDPLKVGFSLLFMVRIKVSGGRSRAVAEALCHFPEVTWCTLTAGAGFDIMAEVLCRDSSHFNTFLIDELQPMEGVVDTECTMLLEMLKTNYGWGFPHLESSNSAAS